MRLPVVFILITVLLDAMGIGIIMPVMPELIQEVSGESLGNAALWGGVLTAVFAAMQFLFGPLIGNLSDAFGRRPVLLLALFVMMLDYLLMAVAGTVWLLLIGRMIGGITAATHSTAGAYMADISKPDEKAANFGLIGAAFGLGFVVGPMVGGLLADLGTRAPFYAAAAFAFANMAFGFFILPETVKPENRRAISVKNANPLGSFSAIGRLPNMGRMLTILGLFGVAHYVYPAIWAYYGTAQFGWDPRMIGISLACFGVSMAVVQAVLVKPMLRILGDRNTVLFAFTIDIIAMFCAVFVKESWLILALTPVMALGSVSTPAIQGIMSRAVADNRQGELQGVMQSIGAVGAAISPLLMTAIFWAYTDANGIYLPGAPFVLSAGLVALCIVLFAWPALTNTKEKAAP
ncbi:tetracycline resistance MFS efflux pump [Marivivens niveibacter]|uniref:Tetracycline resistance MFS efflux pump n=1 Tax=Marivivens niveibacter TaxID=1930667 RepID=A0A251X055_9RHOB|nr:TCR/Tet family MFS transporter [Marivivens niveibacter]OUD09966.1 tetracycline resistance MFS efflux pump [Marivivens niveibacter]